MKSKFVCLFVSPAFSTRSISGEEGQVSIYVFVSMSVDTWAKQGRTHSRLPQGVTTGDGSRWTLQTVGCFTLERKKW